MKKEKIELITRLAETAFDDIYVRVAESPAGRDNLWTIKARFIRALEDVLNAENLSNRPNNALRRDPAP